MMMNAEMIKNIKKVAEEMDLSWDYEFVWDNGDDTGVEHDGICVCSLDRLGVNNYFGDHVAIICGNEAEYGEDDGELIIRDAEVVKVIC